MREEGVEGKSRGCVGLSGACDGDGVDLDARANWAQRIRRLVSGCRGTRSRMSVARSLMRVSLVNVSGCGLVGGAEAASVG
jgi:hypothetical protein